LRRRTWRKKHAEPPKRRPGSSPTSITSVKCSALCLTALFIAAVTLAVAGPDYITQESKYGSSMVKLHSVRLVHVRAASVHDLEGMVDSRGRLARLPSLSSSFVPFCLKARPLQSSPFHSIQVHSDKLAYLHQWSEGLFGSSVLPRYLVGHSVSDGRGTQQVGWPLYMPGKNRIYLGWIVSSDVLIFLFTS